ncbi:methylmalonyl Co-A mutase-associated GTPase MeaB [Evansella tamaricis]|uniref:Methylmalonyl Co-A mutase-associated GTPase MeaB n=1 Tax=Evansella tamaricis TaxID=2069301 RepID=A0ABS6JKR4_9BACI|nr:methylmalonyl Co-A mutase-associated GTPase MeaB [Evansella tamaricis]MBU9713970.1 methylmalonyl Co-A mutase-associated GTPase MeaB [Evansella tamaricis]
MGLEQLAERVLSGDQRAIAKGISIVEDRKEGHRLLLSRVFPHVGNAHIIGITGSPGAGKSSLVNGLVKEWRSRNKTVAVIAVDPTSPFSGGALLGDRVRMRDHDDDEGVFIRSMGTRGSLGGLSEACQDVVRIMDASGFDVVMVETVGVGQAELDIMKTADTVTLVLYPSGGDLIQAFKAGIMEIADLFVINKADLPGVDQLKGELQDLLHITERGKKGWEPPILETVSTLKRGMEQVVEESLAHHKYLASSGKKAERRFSQRKQEVMRRLQERFAADVLGLVEQELGPLESGSSEERDPYEVAHIIYKYWKQETKELEVSEQVDGDVQQGGDEE